MIESTPPALPFRLVWRCGLALAALVGSGEGIAVASEADDDEVFAAICLLLQQDEPAAAAIRLQPLVDRGDTRAQFTLALLHDIGGGVIIDHPKSLALLRECAARNYAPAVHYLAWKYRVEFGVKSDATESARLAELANTLPLDALPVPEEWLQLTGAEFRPAFKRALMWMMQARGQNNPIAFANLATVSLGGPWAPPNLSAHVHWLSLAADGGHGPSAERLSSYYEMGLFVKEDAAKADHYLRVAAEVGLPDAQFNVARALERDGKDPLGAAAWYQRAADQGHVASMVRLGRMLRDGEGVPEDAPRALRLFRDAAARGDGDALGDLGWMLEHGRGTDRDLPGARDAYEKALAAGNGWAGKALGRMFAEGTLGSRDFAAARAAYEKGAALGSSAAMAELGGLYYSGQGVKKDLAEAFVWYERAAREGYGWAQNRVGWMLRNGYGIEKDDEEAVTWFLLAIKNGEPFGHANLAHHLARGLGVSRDAAEACREFIAALRVVDDAWTAGEFRELLGGARTDEYAAIRSSLDQVSMEPPAPRGAALERTLIWAQIAGPEYLHDPDRAQTRLQRLLEAGDTAGVLDLADRFFIGRGLPFDLAAARFCLREVAGREPATAEVLLARIDLVAGDETARTEARGRLERRANDGNLLALQELGYRFATGEGLPVDLDRAWDCLERMAAAGQISAKLELQKKDPSRSVALRTVFGAVAADPPDEETLEKQIRALPPDVDGNRQPVAIYRAPPVYPLALSAAKISGHVKLSFVVEADGRTSGITCLESTHPLLACAAEACIGQWRFAPQLVDGVAVATHMQLPLVFKLDGSSS